ncbi:MAG: RNA methyltransferase [Saprospiraceae bacterium]
MITNNQIKFVKSLHQNKFRQKYNNFFVEGDKIAQDILKNSLCNILNIFVTPKWHSNNMHLLHRFSNIITIVSDNNMKKISALTSSSPVLIVLTKQSEIVDYTVFNNGNVIFLDGVQDPGNVGTIIRIADWFGIKTVVRSAASADFYHPKVMQSTMGSFLNVTMYTSAYYDLEITQHKTIGAIMNGDSINEFIWPQKSLIVMGNESKGIGESVAEKLDFRITISGAHDRIADSLNVAMAAGIIISTMTKV